MPRFHLLQVANVGRVVGGTGACAWTVTRALPDWRHTVWFFSAIDSETRAAFDTADLRSIAQLENGAIRRLRPDFILLHNVSRERSGDARLPAPSLHYLHSRIVPRTADRTVCCSRWLAERCSATAASAAAAAVLWQGVPAPPRAKHGRDERPLRDELVVGRLCTPTPGKWPGGLVDWYAALAARFPRVRWEFVGCPDGLQPRLRTACRGRAVFVPAGFTARSRLRHWDALVYHHPTLTESFGRTAAEAMRAGCVPIVDDRGGFREQFVEGTGFLCGDPAAFERAMEALHDPGERRRRARRCRAHADETFGVSAFRRRLLRGFERASTAAGARHVPR